MEPTDFFDEMASQLRERNYKINGDNYFTLEQFIEEKHKQAPVRGIVFYKNLIHAIPVVGGRIANKEAGEIPTFYHNKHLFQWIGAAGITKNITFHCFRHTYATLQLFNGTDIYTVSKMLGHKDLKTTQIYAKIVDEAKRKAANKIKINM